jgi:hypothetical protein
MKTKVKKTNYRVTLRCGTIADCSTNESACQIAAKEAGKIAGVVWVGVEHDQQVVCEVCEWPVESGRCLNGKCIQYQHSK